MVFWDTKPFSNHLPFYKVLQTRWSPATSNSTMISSSLAHLLSMTCLGSPVASFSTWSLIHLRTGHVGCVADQVVLALVFQVAIRYSPLVIISPVLHNIRLSSGGQGTLRVPCSTKKKKNTHTHTHTHNQTQSRRSNTRISVHYTSTENSSVLGY